MAKSVLISGGARGIGKASALAFGAMGWNVAFSYRRDKAAADKTTGALEALGATALALQGDTAIAADVLQVYDTAISGLGGLDAVVVNAGIVAPSKPLAEMSIERLREVIDTNVLGALLFAREAARRLPETRSGQDSAIVLVSSAAARLGSPFEFVDYAASKGALDTLTIGLSKELAPSGIRVNGIRPGVIDTDIHASGGEPDRAARVAKNVPMQRPGTAEEVANAIAWLCSEAASYCTGSIIDVAGGR